MARYEKGQKDQTRQRVVRKASEILRRDGLEATTIAKLMGEAGLTHGGFYAHFASKEALFEEALCFAFTNQLSFASKGADPREDLLAWIDWYLSPRHRDRPSKGCPLAALGSELARQPLGTRKALATAGLADFSRILNGLAEKSLEDERVALAYSLLALLVGSLQLARIAPNKTVSDAILSAANAGAKALVS